jgi:2-polyprenyl-3-methyl-5-hydroxy-6-metoxy-1,4-benzoquinol methylase
MDYENKASSYYSNIRHELIGLIDSDKKDLKVLEIGAAYGETLFYLKQKGIAIETVGIDIFEDKKNSQNYKNIDRFIFGNIEELVFPEFENYFDLILLPDVLEHLIEPQIVLNKVHQYLKKEGEIIVSMPNIRHYSAINKIVFKGDFKYEESGIFDYTHRRFYCKKNIQRLLENAHFKTVHVESSIKNFKGRSVAKLVNSLTFKVFEEFFSIQYFFKSKKV